MITAQTFSVLWPFLLNKKKTKICSTFRSSTVLERLVLWISGTASKKHMGTRNAKKRTGGFLTLACYLVGQWLCQTTVCALRQSPTSHCGKPAQCKGLNALREWKLKLHKNLQILYLIIALLMQSLLLKQDLSQSATTTLGFPTVTLAWTRPTGTARTLSSIGLNRRPKPKIPREILRSSIGCFQK